MQKRIQPASFQALADALEIDGEILAIEVNYSRDMIEVVYTPQAKTEQQMACHESDPAIVMAAKIESRTIA